MVNKKVKGLMALALMSGLVAGCNAGSSSSSSEMSSETVVSSEESSETPSVDSSIESSVIVSSDSSEEVSSSEASSSPEVIEWVDHLDDNGNKWTATIVDGKFVGPVILVYANGDRFEGTVSEDGTERLEGKLIYANGMFYEGKFVNDKFEDSNGFFSWSTTGNIEDGDKFEGVYEGGNPISGKKTFTSGCVYEGTVNPDYTFNGNGKFTYPDGCYYQGQFSDNVFNGQGEFHWPGGDSFSGTYVNGNPTHGTKTFADGSVYVGDINSSYLMEGSGKLTYTNNMWYEGEFSNNQFNGQGIFSWSTTGDIKDGNSFEGTFVNGTTDGQTGTMRFPAYYSNGNGIQYFTGVMAGMCYPAEGVKGTGKINYGNQYYEGDLIRYGDNFHRIGQGANVFTGGETCGWFAGFTNKTEAIMAEKVFDRYIGGFNDKDHGWFYGDGIMYIKNADGTPYGYITGNWDWSNAIQRADMVNFDETKLLDAYKDTINLTGSVTISNEGTTFVGKATRGEDGVITKVSGRFTYPDGCYYEGEFKNDLFDGQGEFHWPGGDSFVGTFVNGAPTTGTKTFADGTVYVGQVNSAYCMEGKGKLTYTNKMNYEGDFVNNAFVGEGTFSWSMTGDIKDGPSYAGTFVNGTTDGQTGTMTFPAYYTDAAGIQYWTGVMEGMCAPKEGATGTGRYNYGNQYYEGDLVRYGDNYHRIGQGANVFTGGETCGWFAGFTNKTEAIMAEKVFDRYIGGFNDKDHGWFYGDGIMYIKNADGTPYGYITGNWDWSNSVQRADMVNFDTSMLLDSYKDALNLTGSVTLSNDGITFVGKATRGSDGIINKVSGRFTYPDGCYYEGTFENNAFSGTGEFHWPAGDKFEGTYANGAPVTGTKTFADGCVYVGTVNADYTMGGTGKFTFPNGCYYEGDFAGNTFAGTGKFGWPSGDTFEGTFVGGAPTTGTKTFADGTVYVGQVNSSYIPEGKGKLTYTNNMNYEGDFVNGAFHGQGTFSWSTTGDIKDGNSYTGAFVNGTTDGQTGTMRFPAYYTNGNGLQYFTGVMAGMCYPAENNKGTGKIGYGNQYYEGDLIRQGDNFYRIGQGSNVFTADNNAGWFKGFTNQEQSVMDGKLLACYVGGFNDKDHGWLYGDGIMYIANADGTPFGYVLGNWDWSNATQRTDITSFSTDDLLPEYKDALNITVGQ